VDDRERIRSQRKKKNKRKEKIHIGNKFACTHGNKKKKEFFCLVHSYIHICTSIKSIRNGL